MAYLQLEYGLSQGLSRGNATLQSVTGDTAIVMQPLLDNSTTCGLSNCSHNLTLQEDEPSGKSLGEIVAITLSLSILIMATIIGNILVIVSVCYFRNLQRAANYFLVSLAVADLLVGLTAMPFKLAELVHPKWVLGPALCKLFNANDVLFTTASTVHLGCISIDRYIAIIYPFRYEHSMTNWRLVFMLCCAWILSMCIAYVPIFSNFHTSPEQVLLQEQNPEMCYFNVSRPYAFISSGITFWIPLVIMIGTYQKIFREARKQESEIYTMRKRFHNDVNPQQRNGDNGKIVAKKLRREHRAAKTLGAVMGVFFCCFAPFFGWYTASYGICPKSCKLPDKYAFLRDAAFWFGYANSCMNPILYAYFNKGFRKAFRHLMKGCFSKKTIFKLNERHISLSRSDSQVMTEGTQLLETEKFTLPEGVAGLSFEEFLKAGLQDIEANI